MRWILLAMLMVGCSHDVAVPIYWDGGTTVTNKFKSGEFKLEYTQEF